MQHWLTLQLAMVSMTIGTVSAQASSENLPGFLSIVQSLATMLDPSSTTSASTSSTSHSVTSSRHSSSSSTTKASTISSPTSVSTSSPTTMSTAPTTSFPSSTIAAASTAISSSSPSAAAGNAATGLDQRTKNIILGVTIPLGLIALAAIIAILFLCCRSRRRKRNRRVNPEMRYDEPKFTNDNDWVRGDNHHHGFRGNTGGIIGAGNNMRQDGRHDTAPLMGTRNAADMKAIEDPSYEHSAANTPSQNIFTPAQIVPRKPVPNRFSDGSTATSVSTNNHHNSHDGAMIGAGVGALAGAAAMHYHDQKRASNGNLVKPNMVHKPLGSHPQNQSPVHPSAGPNDEFPAWRPNRPSTPPFSPDDVGSMHRRSQRFSAEPTTGDYNNMPVVAGSINAPTSSQRRSLQNRYSGYGDGYVPRGPSRSPRRRSMSGGGELWEADGMFKPATRRRSSGGEPQYTSTDAAPPLPNQGRYSGRDISQAPLLNSSSPPYNKHLAGAQQASSQNMSYGSSTDSTSNDSWESAQAEVNSWEYNEPGRYPRFSGGSADRMQLIPPGPVWNEGEQRRWSDGTPKSTNGFGLRPDNRRYSSGNGRTQRARFSNGSPDYYNESGLVGRAL